MSRKISRTRDELIADLVDLDRRYRALVASCPREQLTRQINDAWSIAECIQHVALANSEYLPRIKSAIDENQGNLAGAVETLSTAGWFSSYFVEKVIGPQVNRRYKAPKSIRPKPVDPEVALERLVRTHKEIRELLGAKSQPDLNRIRFKNPFVPVIRFTVATAFLIMAAHGRRHLLQAERLRDAAGPPQKIGKAV